jgi:hypothetical protein
MATHPPDDREAIVTNSTNRQDDDKLVEPEEPLEPLTDGGMVIDAVAVTEVIVPDGSRHSVGPAPARGVRANSGRELPWRDNVRIRASVEQTTELPAQGHGPVEVLRLLNQWLLNRKWQQVSERTMFRYVNHVRELWADTTGRTLGEFDAILTEQRVRALAIMDDPDVTPLERSTAQKVRLDAAIAQARLHGFDTRNGPNVAVMVNTSHVSVPIRPGSEEAADRAYRVLEALNGPD